MIQHWIMLNQSIYDLLYIMYQLFITGNRACDTGSTNWY
jgi:hypothetical protein